MEATQQAANRLAERTRTDIVALWRSGLDRAQFRIRAAALVARANVAGVQLADIGLAAEITRALRTPTPLLGLRPNAVQVDQERMARDIDRIAGYDDPEGELGNWAASEPHLTVATAVQDGMRRRGIERWVRQLSGTSCPLCTGWADGIARPVSVPMVRHFGCDCLQVPVLI